jgi:hypothetical protein
MSSTRDVIAMFREDFPGRESDLERIYRSDASFRMLYHDFRDCHAALERWQRQDSPEALRRQLEYAGLIEELAAEILDWPTGHPPPDVTDREEEDPSGSGRKRTQR